MSAASVSFALFVDIWQIDVDLRRLLQITLSVYVVWNMERGEEEMESLGIGRSWHILKFMKL